MFKMDILIFNIDYRVASLFTRYLAAEGTISEGLNTFIYVNSNMPQLTKRPNCPVRTYGRTY